MQRPAQSPLDQSTGQPTNDMCIPNTEVGLLSRQHNAELQRATSNRQMSTKCFHNLEPFMEWIIHIIYRQLNGMDNGWKWENFGENNGMDG